jgi:hypothetical protein
VRQNASECGDCFESVNENFCRSTFDELVRHDSIALIALIRPLSVNDVYGNQRLWANTRLQLFRNFSDLHSRFDMLPAAIDHIQ